MKNEALKLALDALENHTAIKHPQQIHYRDQAITAIKEALAQPNEFNPDWDAMAVMVEEQQRMAKRIEELEALLRQTEQEPVAYFDWLPNGATHIGRIKVTTRPGGRLEMGAYVFKYDNEVLMVYKTDNDNEYPGWREAKKCFYHLNFSVRPIPTAAPPKREWVGLTKEEIDSWDLPKKPIVSEFVFFVEAKLKEKNT